MRLVKRKSALIVSGCLFFLSAVAFPARVISSQVSTKFAERLLEACEASSPKVKTCECYVSAVTKRYNDIQLITIYKLLKLPDANKMFMVAHSPEAISCRGELK